MLLKNHSFSDVNKRIAAFLFLWFMKKNGILYNPDGSKRIKKQCFGCAYAFRQELLSHGANVEVPSPQWFRELMSEEIKNEWDLCINRLFHNIPSSLRTFSASSISWKNASPYFLIIGSLRTLNTDAPSFLPSSRAGAQTCHV